MRAYLSHGELALKHPNLMVEENYASSAAALWTKEVTSCVTTNFFEEKQVTNIWAQN